MISPLLYGTSMYIGKCIFSIKDNIDLIWAAFGAGLIFLLVILCFTNQVGYKENVVSLFCSERRFPILIMSQLDCMFSCAAGCWTHEK